MQNYLNKYIVLTGILLILCTSTIAQNYNADITLIENHSQTTSSVPKKTVKISWYNKVNPLLWAYKGTIGFYQRNISVQIAANCVFETTCSHYSKKLVEEHGIFGGIVLSIERLSRCNRISLVETSALNFSKEGKIKEDIEQYRFK